MREQKPSGGLTQQVTSIGGQRGVPFFSVYWVVEGYTEALAQEVKPEWGIKFQCVEPAGFEHIGLADPCLPEKRLPAYEKNINSTNVDSYVATR